MKLLGALLSLLLTISMVFLFNNRLPLQTPVPPLGSFLDPFHGFWQNSYPNHPENTLRLKDLKDNPYPKILNQNISGPL